MNNASRRKAVCVFCGAKPGNDPKFLRIATDTGTQLAQRGFALVFGGGNVGLMGAVAAGALAAGGEVIGIIPQKLVDRELAHRGVSQLHIVADMATRKALMIQSSDAFLSLPGGLGTLDELFEVLTLRQVGYHDKPSALLNVDGYFCKLIAAIDDFVAAGLVDPRERARLLIANSVTQVLDLISNELAAAPTAAA
jgi:uncharacterized protein (TIGR00730 family)